MATFWFVRHGESTANAAGRLAGRSEVALTERGRAQAASLADALQDAGFTRIVTSSLTRAKDTAAPAAARRGIVPEEAADLDERDFGAWCGIVRAEVRGTPDWERIVFTWDGRPEGGESPREVATRALRWLAEHFREEPTLVVAHGGTLRLVLGLLDGQGEAAIHNGVLENSAVERREVTREGLLRALAGVGGGG